VAWATVTPPRGVLRPIGEESAYQKQWGEVAQKGEEHSGKIRSRTPTQHTLLKKRKHPENKNFQQAVGGGGSA